MGYYLLDNPPASRQFYPSRNPTPLAGASAAPTLAVGVHTVEAILDRIAPDMGAENTAGFVRRRTDPGSYAEILDLDSVIEMVPDSYTTFSVAQSGYNSRTWNIALACRVADLSADDPLTRLLIARLGQRIAAFWLRNGVDVEAACYWGGTDALRRPCLFNHGDVQPADRSDAWSRHQDRAVFDAWLIHDIRYHAGIINDPTEEVDDMAGTWHRWVHEHQGAQYAVLFQGGCVVGKVWLHPDHVGLYTSGAMGPFDASDDFALNAPRLDACAWLGEAPDWAKASEQEILQRARNLPDDVVATIKDAL